jgi:hypothetical protein
MKKTPTMFFREFHGNGAFTLTDAIAPGCEWALAGEGAATRKWDGTSVLVRGQRIYARFDAKPGRQPPPGAIPCDPGPDPETGHWPLWVEANRPIDKWIQEAAARYAERDALLPGTYEACGPKIATRSGPNPEGLESHMLFLHGAQTAVNVARTFDGIRAALTDLPWEGLVFHHPDGRMCKIRRKDFGLPWPVKAL